MLKQIIAHKIQNTKLTLSLIFALTLSLPLRAQFRVVDAEDGNPIGGVYVFDSDGKLLGLSNSEGKVDKYDGMVKLSVMTYESQTVDASTFHGDVQLKPSTFELPEVVVSKTEYTKVTTAFRDIYRSNGKTVLYREGLADYYVNMKTKKATRRIRSCRQFEMPGLRKVETFAKTLFSAKASDLSHITAVKQEGVSDTRGDSTFISATFHGHHADDGIVEINTHKEGMFRHLINTTKLQKNEMNLFGMNLSIKQNLMDWTTNDNTGTLLSLIAVRQLVSYDWAYDKHTLSQVESISDVVVVETESISKDDAKREMKDKSISREVSRTNSLPDIPYDVQHELQGLEQHDFWDR